MPIARKLVLMNRDGFPSALTDGGLDMIPSLLVCAGLLAAGVSEPVAPEARTEAEREVALALWYERQGQDAERKAHLERALRADPSDPRARGLLGRVAEPGTEGDSTTAARTLYEVVRAETPRTAPAQWALGVWCERNGLKAEALAHFTAVTRLDPDDAQAWQRLGRRRFDGRWLTDAQIAAARAEAEAQGRADREWTPRLIAWKNGLCRPATYEASAQALHQVRDPRAVPAVTRVFNTAGLAWSQAWGVRILGRIDAPQAARALAALAIGGRSEAVRQAALEELARRDVRTFADHLIDGFRAPIEFTSQPVGGVGEPGILRVDDPSARAVVERHYSPPPVPIVHETRTGTPIRAAGTQPRGVVREETIVPVDEFGAETRRSVAASQEQLDCDIHAIEHTNFQIAQTNARVEQALVQVTGQTLGTSQPSWAAWWYDQLGYGYKRPEPVVKPTVVEEVKPAYTPRAVSVVTVQRPVFASTGASHSCFAAGTPVLTRNGPRAIETLLPGDLVLSQDAETGALSYQPVLTVFHNEPARTLKITWQNGESVVTTGIHRFWRPGAGWTMARNLLPGDLVRTLGGTARVASISSAELQPVFNLEVARNPNYFVGQSQAAALVHDNTLIAPTTRPFDQAPNLAAAGPGPTLRAIASASMAALPSGRTGRDPARGTSGGAGRAARAE